MIVHRAAWVLPIVSPPIRGGWVALDRGRIAAVGGPDEIPPPGELQEPREPGEAILPALVNAHTHLELSWMRGLVPSAASMPRWVGGLLTLRQAVGQDPPEAVRHAIVQARACGTSLVGDITNTLAAHALLAESELSACVFHELIGFRAADAEQRVEAARTAISRLPQVDRLRCSIVPHAPYSVSPALFAQVARASGGAVASVHLAESPEEIELLRSGGGAWRELLERMGAWDPAWQAPGCGPVEYLDRFGLVTGRLLAVHGVQLTDAELERLAEARSTVVTCPRSNLRTGAGRPPIARFYASGIRVAVGTDSLASVDDLNLFSELAAVRAAAPAVPAPAILESATRSGADALGFGADLGTIEAGKRAELIAVRIPRDRQDVEEYLLGGIEPKDVRWLATV